MNACFIVVSACLSSFLHRTSSSANCRSVGRTMEWDNIDFASSSFSFSPLQLSTSISLVCAKKSLKSYTVLREVFTESLECSSISFSKLGNPVHLVASPLTTSVIPAPGERQGGKTRYTRGREKENNEAPIRLSESEESVLGCKQASH